MIKSLLTKLRRFKKRRPLGVMMFTLRWMRWHWFYIRMSWDIYMWIVQLIPDYIYMSWKIHFPLPWSFFKLPTKNWIRIFHHSQTIFLKAFLDHSPWMVKKILKKDKKHFPAMFRSLQEIFVKTCHLQGNPECGFHRSGNSCTNTLSPYSL